MSLGRDLVDKLKEGASASEGFVEVSHQGIKARAEVSGSGPYGADVRAISVEREAPRGPDDPQRGDRLQDAMDQLDERLGYLPEQVAPLEVDLSSGRGVMRTCRGEVKGREYYEIRVEGGDRIDMERFRGRAAEPGRDRLEENFGHRVIERLVDDFRDVVGDRRAEPRFSDSPD